jgi:hypothetical protein
MTAPAYNVRLRRWAINARGYGGLQGHGHADIRAVIAAHIAAAVALETHPFGRSRTFHWRRTDFRRLFVSGRQLLGDRG